MQRYNPTFLKPVCNRARTTSVNRALYCRVGGRRFDSRGRANNQGLNLNNIKTLYNGILYASPKFDLRQLVMKY